MVSEDNKAGGSRKRKGPGLGPTTLDLQAREVAPESTAVPSEAAPGAAPDADAVKAAPVVEDAKGGNATAGDIKTGDAGIAAAGDLPPGVSEPAAGSTPISEAAPVPDPAPVSEAAPWTAPEDHTAKGGEAAAEGEALRAPFEAVRPETAASSPSSPPPSPPAHSSLPVVLAALLGGVAGGALVLGALASGLIPIGRSTQDTGLADRVAAVEQLVPRIAGAEQDIASNKGAIDQAMTRIASVDAAAKSAAEASTNALNLAGQATKDGDQPAPPPMPDLGPLNDRLGKVESDLAAVRTGLDQVTASVAPVGPMQEELAQTRKDLGALQATVTASSDRAAAYAVALGQLGDAIRSGKPFSAELNTATSFDVSPDALAPLVPLADRGTPSVEALATSFDALTPDLIAAMTPKPAPLPPSAGIMDRLKASFGDIVTVTHDGDGSTADPSAPVQKVSDALHRGDLSAAVAAFKAMPEAGKQAGAGWLAQASAAADALDLIKAQTNAALKKFSGQ